MSRWPLYISLVVSWSLLTSQLAVSCKICCNKKANTWWWWWWWWCWWWWRWWWWKIEQNLKRTSSKVKTHLYASDPDNCLIFNYEFTAEVKKHLVLGTVWEVRFTDEDFHIDLNQELYEECLECTRGVWRKGHDWCGWRRTWRGTRSSCQNNLFGRIQKLPNRFLLKTRPN